MNEQLTDGQYGIGLGTKHMLKVPLFYHLEDRGLSLGVVIRPGFYTDGVTVPRWLRWLFPVGGPWQDPAVVHDYLYSLKIDRTLADAIFFHALKCRGVSRPLRWMMWFAVRWLGKYYRNSN